MSQATGNIRRLLIVGGGAAGWMAAAYLNRLLRSLGCTVTLVESVKLGTSGVGEASDPALVRFVRRLMIDEAELMQQCSATYQLGSKFVNWMQDGHTHWQPFGLCGGAINDMDLFHFWLKSSRAGRGEGPYWSYSLQALLAEQDKAPRPARGPSPILERGEYGYHFDPAGFSDYLRELATSEGVNHLFDDVRQVVVDAAGSIERLDTKSGRALSADLYLDCTDEGLLIEQGLGDSWISWSPWLLCDRIVTLPLPRDPQMPPYVLTTALAAGWMRHVPLSHRVACSYCYASAHLQDAAAIRELLVHGNAGKACAAEPRFQKLRVGRRRNFWLRNCLVLGPACGSVEPTAPTEMFLIQRMLELLVELFPDQALSETLMRKYNEKAAALHEGVRDFALLHYVLGRREDHGFWSASREVPVPESLQALIALHDEHGGIEPDLVFPEPSYHHLFAAAGRLPRRPRLAADSLDFAKVCEILDKMKAQNAEWVERLPFHRALVERLHRPPV